MLCVQVSPKGFPQPPPARVPGSCSVSRVTKQRGGSSNIPAPQALWALSWRLQIQSLGPGASLSPLLNKHELIFFLFLNDQWKGDTQSGSEFFVGTRYQAPRFTCSISADLPDSPWSGMLWAHCREEETEAQSE